MRAGLKRLTAWLYDDMDGASGVEAVKAAGTSLHGSDNLLVTLVNGPFYVAALILQLGVIVTAVAPALLAADLVGFWLGVLPGLVVGFALVMFVNVPLIALTGKLRGAALRGIARRAVRRAECEGLKLALSSSSGAPTAVPTHAEGPSEPVL